MALSKSIATNSLHQALLQIMDEGKLKGHKFRFVEATATQPRLWAPVDFIKYLGYASVQASNALDRFLDKQVKFLTNQIVFIQTMKT